MSDADRVGEPEVLGDRGEIPAEDVPVRDLRSVGSAVRALVEREHVSRAEAAHHRIPTACVEAGRVREEQARSATPVRGSPLEDREADACDVDAVLFGRFVHGTSGRESARRRAWSCLPELSTCPDADSPFVRRSLDQHGVLLATLDRPEKKNAFHEEQWDALADCLNESREDPAVAVVVLTGAGGNFSSGVDLGSFGGDERPPRADGKPSAFFACVDAVFAFDKPLLAAVQGVAVGGGCTLAVASDIVYVGESVRMRLPFANLGLVPRSRAATRSSPRSAASAPPS